MGKEIEKKFLLYEDKTVHASQEFLDIYGTVQTLNNTILSKGMSIIQGYIPLEKGLGLARHLGMTVDFQPVEARLRDKGGRLIFTLKGPGDIERDELEDKNLSRKNFDEYWGFTQGQRIKKYRLSRKHGLYVAELDTFIDRRVLMLAEIETPTIEEAEGLVALGLDVTKDKNYKNKQLAK